MNLTKGKIAKLYNKKNQTAKKRNMNKRVLHKKNLNNYKINTIRHNPKLNLATKSLKRFVFVENNLTK